MKTILRLSLLLVALSTVSCNRHTFKVVLLPDTQTYTNKFPEIFHSQTDWIADNANKIAFVLHQGDITDHNVTEQWDVAAAAMYKLDGKVPYVMAVGNHDLGTRGSTDTRDSELFNRYFPYSKYSTADNFGGVFEIGRMENAWYVFKASGIKWLVLSLEFGPRDSVLEWASAVIEKHPRHKVIINTHAYMYSDDTRMGEGAKWVPQNYPIGKNAEPGAVNDGEQIWEKLVSIHPNIMFVFSGHVLNDGAGRLVSEGINGNKVYQMLANYQGGVIGSQKGGNGFLRILTIDRDRGRVTVESYSPYIDQYKTEPDHSFVFDGVKF